MPLDTATPEPSVTPSPAPTDTATETAEPTSTPETSLSPDQRLEAAATLQRQGAYDRAVALYASVISEDPSSDLASQALFELGNTYHLQGDYALVIDIYDHFMNDYPDSSRLPQVWCRLALAHRERGEWALVAKYYQRYLATCPDASAAIYAGLAEAQINLGQDAQAATAYELALQGELASGQRLDLEEELAIVYRRLGMEDQALLHYGQAAALATRHSHRLWLRYEMANTLREAGQVEDAVDIYQGVMDNDPTDHSAYLSLVAMLDLEYPVDTLQRAMIDYYAGQYQIAIKLFDEYAAPYETEPVTTALTITVPMTATVEAAALLPVSELAQAHLYRGLSYRQLELYDEAIAAFEHLAETYPNSGLVKASLYQVGRCHELAGQEQAAMRAYGALVDEYPQYELADLALWRQAQVLEGLEDWPAAADVYQRLVRDYPQSGYVASARFWQGMVFYHAADYQAARTAWSSHLDAELEIEIEEAAKLLVWCGKAAAHGQDAESAEAYWQEAAALAPDHFYGLRAETLAAGTHNELLQSYGDLNWYELDRYPAPSDQVSDAVVNWLAGWSQAEMSVQVAQQALRALAGYRHGLDNLACGAIEAAQDEFRQLYYDHTEEPLFLYLLAVELQAVEQYRLASACVERILLLADQPLDEVPADLLRISYPAHYAELVLPEAKLYGIDPRLFFALMRQESRFDTWATSWAGARGLAQVMPATGEWIAWRLGDDFETQHLYRPNLSIEYGLWYLSVALDMFDGNILAALAGYNGGPGNVETWAGGLPVQDVEAFVENIGPNETRTYVRTIWEQYALYRRLYPMPEG